MKKCIERFILAMLALICVYLVGITIKQEFYLNEVNQQTQIAQQRLEEAQKLNDKLQEEKANLEKPEYIEKVARDELGMTKPGEVPYISSDKK